MELIAAIVELKRRNPKFCCVRIAQQISHAFSVDIDEDIVRRVLTNNYRPDRTETNGPSWLTFIEYAKDNLWSIDLFRCESILLRSHCWLIMLCSSIAAAFSKLQSPLNYHFYHFATHTRRR